MENPQQDEPFKDTTPAAPIESVPESASTPVSSQESEAPFDDPESLDEDEQVVTGDEEPPVPTGEETPDPGNDPDVPSSAAPETHSVESVEADRDDQRGEGV